MYVFVRQSLAAVVAGIFLLVLAASGIAGHAVKPASGTAVHQSADMVLVANGGNGGNGGSGGSGGSGGNGGNGGGGKTGDGTATPELPSGVLFGVGLLPLVIVAAWIY